MIAEGQQLGEFTVLERLDQGAMGAVYKARQPLLDRIVALKILQAAVPEESGSWPHSTPWLVRLGRAAVLTGLLGLATSVLTLASLPVSFLPEVAGAPSSAEIPKASAEIEKWLAQVDGPQPFRTVENAPHREAHHRPDRSLFRARGRGGQTTLIYRAQNGCHCHP